MVVRQLTTKMIPMMMIATMTMTMMTTMMMMTTITGVAGDYVSDDAAVSRVFWEAVGEVSVGQLVTQSPESGLNQTCFQQTDNYSSLSVCLRSQCVSGDDVAKLYGVRSEQKLDASDLSRMSAGLVYVLTSQTPSCSSDVYRHHESPSAASVWGYGLLFVTLINICSMLGACILPCVNTALYKVLLIFMVALAVGTLVGSGLLVLIPEALALGEEGGHDYLWKMTTVMGGVYLFFLVERIMRYINNRREDTRDKKDQDRQATEGTYTSYFQMHAPDTPHARMKKDACAGIRNCAFSDVEQTVQPPGDLVTVLAETDHPRNRQDEATSTTTTTATSNNNKNSEAVKKSVEGGHSHGGGGGGGGLGGGERVRIAPVAYMVIFGDALHNLIDGLSIGAAFTESTLLGISLSVAVMCEELPHELGDFAILLNAGMSMRKALLYNFLSSLSCYVGLVIGIQLGENTHANTWIFAIAGGMFLYISLADMLPEMNSAAESADGKEFGEVKTFLVQNLGLLIGFGIILLLALYGDQINFG